MLVNRQKEMRWSAVSPAPRLSDISDLGLCRRSLMAVAGLCASGVLCGCISGTGALKTVAVENAPGFVMAPATVVEGDKVRITFAADRKTDVAVCISDSDGKIVRHLAAGALGNRAPAPFRKDSLEQSLIWDRLDDAGRPLPAGWYRAEVGLGLSAGAVKSIGWSPRALGRVHGLAVGPDGSLYTMSEGDFGFCRIQLFDDKGRHRRLLAPRSGNLSLGRAVPLGDMVLNDGQRIPRELLPQYGGDSRQGPMVTPGGDLIFVNDKATGRPEGRRFRSQEPEQPPVRRLLRLAPDGGAPAAGYLGPVLGKGFEDVDLYLAPAPDGKSVYVSGAQHAVFRVVWGGTDRPAPVVGTPDSPGENEKLKNPCGIALDAAGNLYVADHDNHRIAVFSPDGKFQGQMAVEWPRQVMVHPQTGAIYTVGGYRPCRLLKHLSLSRPQPVAQMDLGSTDAILTLDPRSRPAVIYAANALPAGGPEKWTGPVLVRLVDAGERFVVESVISRGFPIRPFLMGADRDREWIYAFPNATCANGYVRIDGRTGRPERFDMPLYPKSMPTSEMTVGRGGMLAFHAHKEIGRLDRDLRPAPFASIGTYMAGLPEEDPAPGDYDRGLCMAPGGDIYWISGRGGPSKPMRCSTLGPDGTVTRDSLIVFESGAPASIRVDRQGSIYVMAHLKPTGKTLPNSLIGKAAGDQRGDRFVYNYGSLLKFGPEGGAVRIVAPDRGVGAGEGEDATEFTTAEGRGRYKVDGLVWGYFGVSMVQPSSEDSRAAPRGSPSWAARFDLDDFGRVFVPDELRCAVQVLDSGGNPVLRLGRYGNAEDPGLALADPRTVAVTDEAAYFGDPANQRLLRVELGYKKHATSLIGLGGAAGQPGSSDQPAPEYRAADAGKQRLAAVWGMWGAPKGDSDRARLREALSDPSPLIRAAAAHALLDLGDRIGQIGAFRAARSDDPDVRRLGETAILKRTVLRAADDPTARMIEAQTPLVPRFPIGNAEVDALIPLLETREPAVSGAVICLLGQSGRREAAQAILSRLKAGGFRDRNLNRALGALGVLRCREAVPEALKYLSRGRAANFGTAAYDGDEAEIFAANALGCIADPASVEPIISLLDSDKPGTAAEALRALSLMFHPGIPEENRLVPTVGRLEMVLVDEIPSPREVRAEWESFRRAMKGQYHLDQKGPPAGK